MTNKELVMRVIEDVFNAHDLSKLDEYMRDDYMQHSIEAADGKEGFRKFCEGFFKMEPHMEVFKMFESDDNTVAVFFKCTFKNGHAAVYDKYDYYLSDYKKKEAAVQTAKPSEEKEKTEDIKEDKNEEKEDEEKSSEDNL